VVASGARTSIRRKTAHAGTQINVRSPCSRRHRIIPEPGMTLSCAVLRLRRWRPRREIARSSWSQRILQSARSRSHPISPWQTWHRSDSDVSGIEYPITVPSAANVEGRISPCQILAILGLDGLGSRHESNFFRRHKHEMATTNQIYARAHLEFDLDQPRVDNTRDEVSCFTAALQHVSVAA